MEHRGTRFGSLAHYEKGGVEVINDDARNYVFSNLFEVASKSKPYEKVAVGKNIEYVIEAIRTEGEWSLLFYGGEYSHAVLKRPRRAFDDASVFSNSNMV